LIVMGVHTPECSFEPDIDRMRQATKLRGMDYLVAVDNDHAIRGAFANHYSPALYFINIAGVVRDHHFGEGRYEHSERTIQRLLSVERDLVSVEGLTLVGASSVKTGARAGRLWSVRGCRRVASRSGSPPARHRRISAALILARSIGAPRARPRGVYP
jgi:hypothetical protein